MTPEEITMIGRYQDAAELRKWYMRNAQSGGAGIEEARPLLVKALGERSKDEIFAAFRRYADSTEYRVGLIRFLTEDMLDVFAVDDEPPADCDGRDLSQFGRLYMSKKWNDE